MDIPQPVHDADLDPDICGLNQNGTPNEHQQPRHEPVWHGNHGSGLRRSSMERQRAAANAPPLIARKHKRSTKLSHSEMWGEDWAEPNWGQSFRNMIRSTPVLVSLPVLLPISWALYFSKQNPVAVFVTSLLAIVPLAGGIGFATEELATRMGDAWGGLMNATFGNLVELLVAILALARGDLDIVQASMAGSILSNILLVLGMSYFAGGLRFHEQLYAVVGAQTHISLLGVSLLAVLLPMAYHLSYPMTLPVAERHSMVNAGWEELDAKERRTILAMSRGLSMILLVVYVMYLTFQLWTHAYLFRQVREDPVEHALPPPSHSHVFPRPVWVPSVTSFRRVVSHSQKSHSEGTDGPPSVMVQTPTTTETCLEPASDNGHDTIQDATGRPRSHSSPNPTEAKGTSLPDSPDLRWREKNVDLPAEARTHVTVRDYAINLEVPNPGRPASSMSHSSHQSHMSGDVEAAHNPYHARIVIPHPAPRVRMWFALICLATFTGLAGLTAECLVSSIDGLTEHTGVSREFVGLILLPVIGNAVEHVTAVTVSLKDRLNLSLSIAVGSSVQVSLCLLPLIVLIGWAIGQPMTLLFDYFETICLFVAVLLVNFAIADGRTNYMEGFALMVAYISMALVTWFYDPVH